AHRATRPGSGLPLTDGPEQNAPRVRKSDVLHAEPKTADHDEHTETGEHDHRRDPPAQRQIGGPHGPWNPSGFGHHSRHACRSILGLHQGVPRSAKASGWMARASASNPWTIRGPGRFKSSLGTR